MRPVPIPDELVWQGAERRVIAGPGGDLTGDIRPVEAVIDEVTDRYGTRRRHGMRLMLEAGDLERLHANPHFWLLIDGGHLHPFAVVHEDELLDPPPPRPPVQSVDAVARALDIAIAFIKVRAGRRVWAADAEAVLERIRKAAAGEDRPGPGLPPLSDEDGGRRGD